jgi:hypothetical protein
MLKDGFKSNGICRFGVAYAFGFAYSSSHAHVLVSPLIETRQNLIFPKETSGRTMGAKLTAVNQPVEQRKPTTLTCHS